MSDDFLLSGDDESQVSKQPDKPQKKQESPKPASPGGKDSADDFLLSGEDSAPKQTPKSKEEKPAVKPEEKPALKKEAPEKPVPKEQSAKKENTPDKAAKKKSDGEGGGAFLLDESEEAVRAEKKPEPEKKDKEPEEKEEVDALKALESGGSIEFERVIIPAELTPEWCSALVKATNLSILQTLMYPPDHPMIVDVMRNSFSLIRSLADEYEEFSIGTVENKLFVEKVLLDEKDMAAKKFISIVKKIGIDNVTFMAGVEMPEVAKLFRAFGMKHDIIESKGGIRAILRPSDTPHIRLEKARYERIVEGEVVVKVEDGEKIVKVPEGEKVIIGNHDEDEKDKKASMFTMISQYFKGELKDIEQLDQVADIVKEMKKDPRRFALLVMMIGKEVKNLQLVVERLGKLFVDHVMRTGGKTKTDLSKLLMSVSKEIQKEMLHSGSSKGDMTEAVQSLGNAVSRFADAIKINTIVAKYASGKRVSAKKMQDDVKKMFEDEEEKKRLMPQLEEKLSEAGMDKKKVKNLMEKVEDMKVGKDRKVEVDNEKLESLLAFKEQAEKDLKQMEQLKKKLSRADEYIKDLALSDEEGEEKEAQAQPEAPEEEMAERGIVKIDTSALKDGSVKKINSKELDDGRVAISKDDFQELVKRSENFDQLLVEKLKNATTRLVREKIDITRQKETLDALIKKLAEGVIVVNEEDRVMLINRAAEELLGVPKEEIVGKHILDGVREEHVVAMSRHRNEMDEDLPVSDYVEVSSIEENTKKTIQASTAMIQDVTGSTVGMLFVLTDVEKERRLESMKNNFINKISDELENPLQAVLDTTSLLANNTAGKLNDEQQRLIDISMQNIKHLSKLITQMIHLSKLKAGKIELSKSKNNMVELIESCSEIFDKWAQEKQVELVLDVHENKLEGEFDYDKIKEVVINLVSNAIKFSSKGQSVTIAADSIEDQNGRFIKVSVIDAGDGMTDDDVNSLFKAFTQLGPESKKRKGEGLGMGLALSRELVELHGGRIWVKSQWGMGSTFTFIIPVS